VPDGSSLNITLVIEDFGRNEIVVAQLGKVVAPAKSFAVAIPQPFPAEWVGGEKLKDNKGTETKVTIEIIKSDDASVTSYKTFADDPEFNLVCCPITDTVSCGCDGCNCATNDTCAMGLACTDPLLGAKKCRPVTATTPASTMATSTAAATTSAVTTTSGTTAPTSPAQCTDGLLGCNCLVQGSQKGCSQLGLVCNALGKCEQSSTPAPQQTPAPVAVTVTTTRGANSTTKTSSAAQIMLAPMAVLLTIAAAACN
jgi:hypothetical protein